MCRRDHRGQISLEYAALVVLVAAVLGVIFAAGIRYNVDDAAQRSMCRIFDEGSDCGAGPGEGAGPDGSDPPGGSDPDGGTDPDDPDGTDPDGTDPDDPDGTDPDGGDDSDEDGNGIDDDLEDEAEDMAEDLAEQAEDDPGFFEVNSFGECAEVAGQVPGVGGTADGCLVYDGDVVAILGSVGGGPNATPLPGASLMGGPIISNAESVDDLTGPALCVGGSAEYGVGVGGDLCFGLGEDGEAFTGTWTIWAGAGVGTPDAEGHFYLTETAKLAELDVPDVPSVEEVTDWVEDRGMEFVEGAEAAGEVLGDIADGVGDAYDATCRNVIVVPCF